MQRVIDARKRTTERERALPQAPSRPLVAAVERILLAYQNAAAALVTPQCAVVLSRNNFDRAFVGECRARAARVELSSVDAERRRWAADEADSALICDRLRPRAIADLLPASRIWYTRLREHIKQADPKRLLVICGRVGCGKSCLVDVAVRDAGAAAAYFTDAGLADDGDEAALWESVVTAALRSRRDKRTTLVVIDNADTLSRAKLALDALRRVARSPQRVALVAIVNNWYGRAGVVNALRAHVDAERKAPRARKPVALTAATKKKGVADVKLEIVQFECQPMHTAEAIKEHLCRCAQIAPRDQAGVQLCAALARECDGDVRSAMQRLDMILRQRAGGAGGALSQRDVFATNSPVYQLRDAIDEMRALTSKLAVLPTRATASKAASAQRLALTDSYAVVERRFQTLDTAQTAEELLFANYPRMLGEQSDLETACEITERLSDADALRTLEQQQCYKGASNNVTLAIGVGAPARLLATRTRSSGAGLQMDFARMRAQTRASAHGAMLATLDPLLLHCGRAYDVDQSNDTLFTANFDGERVLHIASTAPPSLERVERVAALGRYASSETSADYYRRRVNATELSRPTIATLGRLKGRARPEMMNEYQMALRALGLDQKQLDVYAANKIDRTNGLRAAALGAGMLGLTERDFALAAVFADSLRCCIDPPAEYKLVTKDEAVAAFRAAKVAHQKVMLKRRRVDVETPALRSGKRRFAEPRREEVHEEKVENDDDESGI